MFFFCLGSDVMCPCREEHEMEQCRNCQVFNGTSELQCDGTTSTQGAIRFEHQHDNIDESRISELWSSGNQATSAANRATKQKGMESGDLGYHVASGRRRAPLLS